MVRSSLCSVVLLAGSLLAGSGCLGVGDPWLATTVTTYDSAALFEVEQASTGFQYRDLDILVNGVPYHLGPAMDHGQRWFAVEEKNDPDELVMPGDRIWLPGAGRLDLAFQHKPTDMVVQRFSLKLQDQTPPPAPRAASGDERGLAVLNWTRVDDASGVTYVVELWPLDQGRAEAAKPLPPLVADPLEEEAPVPVWRWLGLRDHRLDLGDTLDAPPGSGYGWRVRAVDGQGQVGPWSPTSTLTLG